MGHQSPRGGPSRPPSVLTPLVPLHYSTCGEGKGALPGLFYATAAMMQGHVQLHMNPGIHSHAAESRRGARFGTIGKGQSPCGCACARCRMRASPFLGLPLPPYPSAAQATVHQGRPRSSRQGESSLMPSPQHFPDKDKMRRLYNAKTMIGQ